MSNNTIQSTGWKGKTGTLLICVALAAVVFAAFEGVRNNDFVTYDDDGYIIDNAAVQNGLNIKSIEWAFTTWHKANWHPLTWVSHIIDCSVFGLNPGWHHLANVGFHIANAVLLFLILKRMTGAFWPSVFVAAVFGLHPLTVESVAWASQRKNVLSTFFALLTIAAYYRYTRKPNTARYLLVAVTFAAGLLAKPMLVTLPFVLILLDYWPIGRFDNTTNRGRFWPAIADKLPLLFMSAAASVMTYLAQANSAAVADTVMAPLALRFSNALVSYVRYIEKMFYLASLALLYPLDLNEPGLWLTIGCAAALLLATAVVILKRHGRGYLLMGWLWYLGTLVPVIGLVQVGSQAMADRYAYWPGIGIYIIIAWLAQDIAARFRPAKVIFCTAGIVALVILLAMTRVQVGYWKDSLSLYEHSAAVTKNNYVMHNNSGEIYRTSDHPDKAMEHFRRALEINPSYVKAYNNIGCLLGDNGLFAEAATAFEQAIAIEPGYIRARTNYGIVLAKQGLYDKAIEQFTVILLMVPDDSEALNNLWQTGIKGNKPSEVLKIITVLQQTSPDNAELCYRAGVLYGMQQQTDEAIPQLEKAVKLNPDHAAARGALGRLLFQKGRFRESAAQYDISARLDPTNVETLYSYAMLLTHAPDPNIINPELATALAQEACRLTDYNQPDPLDILARVYASQKKWPEAINAAQQAIDAATRNGKNELAGQIKGRLELYQQAGEPKK